jgi:hypothetical protein
LEGGTTTAAGRDAATLAGVTSLGFGSGAGASAGGAAGFVTTDFGAAGACAAGFTGSAAFAAGGRGAATGCAVCCVIAFRTSPGLDIFERSIFGLNSSVAAALLRELPDPPLPCCPAKYAFTRSASSASIELECVFFSVTPTFNRTSRIALLLTSSSRAKSLIRIFIRPSFPPQSRPSAKPSSQPHG